MVGEMVAASYFFQQVEYYLHLVLVLVGTNQT